MTEIDFREPARSERGDTQKGRAELTLSMTGALQRSSQSGFGSSLIVRRECPVMVSSELSKKNHNSSEVGRVKRA